MMIRIKDTVINTDAIAYVQKVSGKELEFQFDHIEDTCIVSLGSKQECDEKFKLIADLLEAREI